MSSRDLVIKTNILKRLAKEQIFYIAERESQQAKIDAMVAADPEDYNIKKQREVLDETLDMLPDVERRKRAAKEDLANFINHCSPDLKALPEYDAALQVLEANE